MDFIEFRNQVKANLDKMYEESKLLYKVNLNGDELWEQYLESFPAGSNEIFRERRAHDCQACKHFIRYIGSVISITEDLNVKTIWDDVKDPEGVYNVVADVLSKLVREAVNKVGITGVFYVCESKIGIEENFEKKEGATEVITWNHFYTQVPNLFVKKGSDIGTIASDKAGDFQVFKSGMENLTEAAITDILDLCKDDNLYRGDQWIKQLEQYRDLKKEYSTLPDEKKILFCWHKVGTINQSILRIKNTSIGTLLEDVSQGKDLEEAVKAYESIVSSGSYKRPKAIFTQKMLDDAKAKIEELGYTASLKRRMANANDINVKDILFINRDEAKTVTSDDPFDDLSKSAKQTNKYKNIPATPISEFLKELPNATSLEAYVEPRHVNNLCSLITSEDPTAKSMFKWDNNFSWAYKGNITDSIKKNVEKAGGNINGVLRFSIQWNDNGDNSNDFDAHCYEPGEHIYFGSYCKSNYGNKFSPCGGILDVDIRNPRMEIGNRVAVENIVYATADHMKDGVYKFSVNNFAHRGGRSGFSAEIECNGTVYSFNYDKELRQDETIQVAEVKYSNGTFEVKPLLDSTASSKEIWGIHTNDFVPVQLVCTSPNYWGSNAVGNKHYMFFLSGCRNSEEPNGFYNEFLNSELEQHRRVMEALGSKMHVQDAEHQLSGLGFSSTIRNDLVVRIDGNKVYKIEF